MKILLHVCCAPCTVYPLDYLRRQGHEVSGFFFNPNIHPYREFRRRIKGVDDFARQRDFKVDIDRNYGLKEYMQRVVFNENRRCSICYDMRLEPATRFAVEQGADAFTSTLLYSRYQNHQLLIDKCEKLAALYGIKFYYSDFREGWQQGIDGSIEMDLYRQPYCGCIYSEQERYDKKFRKKIQQQRKSD